MSIIAAAAAGLLFCSAPAAHGQQAPLTTYDKLQSPSVEALPAVPAGKLPDRAVPLAYRLDLTLDPSKEHFSGHLEIDLQLKVTSSWIDLHARDLKFSRVIAFVQGVEVPGRIEQADDTGAARAFFSKMISGPVTLKFDYTGAFNDVPAGLFRLKVGEDWYSWSQFESIDGRSAFPSFDQPSFKTPFTVTLRTPPGLMAVSNTRQLSVTQENGLDVHRFEPTLPLPTYLVAMMTGPFVTAESTVPSTPQRSTPLPLRIISTKQNAGKLQFALEGSKVIVAKLESYFDQAFPFPKLDQITNPIMPGAMENAGADLYNESILVLDEAADADRKRRFGMVVAHELAHQWYGDLVTPAWWDDIWLNESFANWMGFRIGDEWRPELKIAAGTQAEGFQAMGTDALLAGRPIRQAITRNSQIDRAFDTITYGKGGHVVAMIAAYMGDDTFRTGVRRYMAAHRFGNATSDDFFAALAQSAGDTRLITALRSFTDQQGVPLLTFAEQGDHITVSQSRYLPLGVQAEPAQWVIPLCARKADTKHCFVLDQQSSAFSLSGTAPLMPNVAGAGYFRFELSPKAWDTLIDQASSLSGNEALATTDSLSASFRAGRARPDQLVRLADRLLRNPDSQAQEMAGDMLRLLSSANLIDPDAMPKFRKLVQRMYQPILQKYGFDPGAGIYAKDNPDLAQSRLEAVGRLIGLGRDQKLNKLLRNAAEKFLSGDQSALDPVWYEQAFDAWLEKGGGKGGGLSSAKNLLEKALSTQNSEFRQAAMDALSTNGKPTVATWLLNDVADARLRRNEQRQFLRGALAVRSTRDIGYRWLHDHLDMLIGNSEGIFFSSRLPQMLSGFCSAEQAKQLEQEILPKFIGKAGELEMQRSLERIRNCSALHQARTAEVSAYFANAK